MCALLAALDNLDYNPSSSTAQGSFHGTGISIIQFQENGNQGIPQQIDSQSSQLSSLSLPSTYTTVPAISIKQADIKVPKTVTSEIHGNITEALESEKNWTQHGLSLLQKDLNKGDAISWAAFHAANQPDEVIYSAITALLPLFAEKADTPAMIKHGMSIIKTITDHLNPGQVPVMACDCPIFANSKYVQWKYPDTHGEKKFIIMFGGLHLEKA